LKHKRRKYLSTAVGLLGSFLLPACSRNASTIANARTNAQIPRVSKEEVELLRNLDTRRTNLKDKPLVVRGRLFDSEIRLSSFELENTQFIDCDFVRSTMLGGNLKNVVFQNCLFVANLWDEGRWDNVSFTKCAWRGRFNMGPSLGDKDLIFDDCDFVGATAKETGYGGPADYFGIIGGTNGNVFYRNSRFERTYINGGLSLSIVDCKMMESVLVAKDEAHLLVERVSAEGVIKVGLGRGKFNSVTVRNSTFGRSFIFEGTHMGIAIFEDVVADLNLSIVKASSIDLKRVKFNSPAEPNPQFQYGSAMESANVGKVSIVDCDFGGRKASLHLMGEKDEDEEKRDKNVSKTHVNYYSTDFDSLTIKNTKIDGGEFAYMNIGVLLLENLEITNSDFSNSKIVKLVLRNVSLSGQVEYAHTLVGSLSKEGVTDTSTGTPPVLPRG
jgi:uncharacterized protein YjbI with pentapeptide repeats